MRKIGDYRIVHWERRFDDGEMRHVYEVWRLMPGKLLGVPLLKARWQPCMRTRGGISGSWREPVVFATEYSALEFIGQMRHPLIKREDPEIIYPA